MTHHATPISDTSSGWPRLARSGFDMVLVQFADQLSDAANRAAMAFRAALDAQGLPGVVETSTSLVSVVVRFDPLIADPTASLADMMQSRDWYAADLPQGRRLWHLPTVFGGDLGPHLDEAAAMAGLSPDAAVAEIARTRLRVQTIGFAPGQPYLGALPPHWDIPRQTHLTERVLPGAVTVAIRQIVLFAVTAPTGWRHIGQTAFQPFRAGTPAPFVLRPGDEVRFEPVARPAFDALVAKGPDGGAWAEDLP